MKRDRSRAGYRVEPFPNIQRQQVDWLDLMQRQHTIHALLEVDVTGARQSIREFRSKTGEPLSFTAFVVWCVGRAVDADRRMHAYRKGRGHLVVFDEVDVTVPVERTMEGKRVPVPYILRAANKKELTEIHREIRSAQVEEAPQARAVRWLPLWLLLPGFLRRFIWATLLGNPHRRKKVMGTVAVTAVGMFGQGPAWGIPLTLYTLCVTVGGIARKPGVVRDGAGRRDERIEVREYLSLTLSMDHDVIDGAPAARFAAHVKELIEGGVR
jgi:pyruvate/2-oxoglutarate dehydrogenase complex dihydrolipoamide acyltransferase (E2) component